VEFRLTYSGVLLASSKTKTRAAHKQELRKHFHRQLKTKWDASGLDLDWYGGRDGKRKHHNLLDGLASEFARLGFNFVPFVTREADVNCSIDLLMLRPNSERAIFLMGDIDGRLKTIFDALKMPQQKSDLGGYDDPDEDEKPFFVLLEDDSLVTRVAVETDYMLEPVRDSDNANDVRLILTIKIGSRGRVGPHNDHLS
jgi:hypothetical protein